MNLRINIFSSCPIIRPTLTISLITIIVLSIIFSAWLLPSNSHPLIFLIKNSNLKLKSVITTTSTAMNLTTTVKNEIPRSGVVRYLCTNFCPGWGDQLKGIISAYAWSLLTNRYFEIPMAAPCSLGEFFEPNLVDWPLKIPRKNKTRFQPRQISHRGVGYEKSDYLKMENEDIIAYSKNASELIEIFSGAMFMNSFAVNPHLASRIRELGYEPSKFKLQYRLHEWYSSLLKLTPEAQLMYDAFMSKTKKSEGYKLVCAQIRIGGRIRLNVTDLDFVENATATRNDFWKFIKEKFLANITDSKYMIYLTTDNEVARKEAVDVFDKGKVITHEESNYHFGNIGDFFPRNITCDKVKRTWFDFHALKECDKAVVSHSGFGLLGVWNRPDPAKDLYIYSTEERIKTGRFSRTNLSFIKLDNLDEFIPYHT